MGSRLTDSQQYAHLWGRPELARVFDERARLQSWLDILSALATAQARVGLIPAEAATQIAVHARAEELNLDLVAQQTRQTSHSMLGVIRGLQAKVPDSTRDHVAYGVTVQDVTDTWLALVMREVGALVWRDLHTVEGSLLDLAVSHRDTLMLGRTHGQPGSPVTFGFKVACWADEARRHLERLRQGRPRWLVGQLAGSVGVLGFFGSEGSALRAHFCTELGLGDPQISWLTSRDRVTEFCHLLSMICATIARIGTEVYELQRPEIGELREPGAPTAIGSITLPRQRNPAISEHLATLARLTRANAELLVEGMIVGHEGDDRGQQAEWVALSEVCLLTGTALQLARRLVSGLHVDTDAMQANLERYADQAAGERLLLGLSERLGLYAAHQLLHELDTTGLGDVQQTVEAVVTAGVATAEECADWLSRPSTGTAGEMVDTVVRRGLATRASEPETWQ
ncbi:MAG: class-II fumarase/aspartase family protein [Nocardioidaceae bacterium]